MTDPLKHYRRFVGNHYAGNETWSDNIHDLYHHLRAGDTRQAVALIQTMRAALNAIEAALHEASEAA